MALHALNRRPFPRFGGALNGGTGLAAAGLTLVALLSGALAWSMNNLPASQWVVVLLVPILFGVGMFIILAVTKDDDEPMVMAFGIALGLKFVASFVRYYFALVVYGGLADSTLYDTTGRGIARSYRDGSLSFLETVPRGMGTDFLHRLTGFLYVLLGPSQIAAYIVMSWIGFFGQVLFIRAVRVSGVSVDVKRYTYAILFLPSLLYWPSALGKESIMMLGIGIATYGAARLFARRRYGIVTLLAGLLVAGAIRPHVAGTLLVSVGVAIALGRGSDHAGNRRGAGGRIVIVGLIAVGCMLAFSTAVNYFFPDGGSSGLSAVTDTLDKASTGTAGGGSQFDGATPNSPLRYPNAIFSVFFRPLPWEASSAQTMLASAEAMALLAVIWIRRRVMLNALRKMTEQPFLIFAAVYTALFGIAWSSFSNVGALARQRVQVWPVLLIFIVLSAPRRHEGELPPAHVDRARPPERRMIQRA